MVEELLQSLVSVVDAQLLKAVELEENKNDNKIKLNMVILDFIIHFVQMSFSR